MLQKHIKLKESDATQGMFELSINIETKHKYNNNSVILQDILSRKQSPNDKMGIGFVDFGRDIFDK